MYEFRRGGGCKSTADCLAMSPEELPVIVLDASWFGKLHTMVSQHLGWAYMCLP